MMVDKRLRPKNDHQALRNHPNMAKFDQNDNHENQDKKKEKSKI